jgi:hypothetical protein
MNMIAGGIFSPITTIVPSTTSVSTMLNQKFFGRRSAFCSSVSSRFGMGIAPSAPVYPSRFSSRRPSHQATLNTNTRPTICTGINGLNNADIGRCSDADARIIGPVHGRKLMPAAIDAAAANTRLSILRRS